MKKQIMRATILAVSTLCIIVLSMACSPSSGSRNQADATRITDYLGRSVEVPAQTARIISLAPSNTEILFELGLTDRVVAVTDYCDYPAEAKDKPSIGGFSNPNLEEIIALQPDLILATSMHEQTIISQLEKHGLTVFALDPKTLEEVCEAITIVGVLTGKEKDARAIVGDIQKRREAVQSVIAPLAQQDIPAVFYAVWHDPLMGAGSDTLQDVLINLAGGDNIASGLNEYADISLEYIVDADPEVIIANNSHGSNVNETYNFLLGEPRLESVAARIHNRIYEIDGNLSSRPGPRLVEGLELFAGFIHPELFD